MLTKEQKALVNEAHTLKAEIETRKTRLSEITDSLKRDLGVYQESFKFRGVTLTLSIIRTKEGIGVDTVKVKAEPGWQKKYGKSTGGDLRLTIK